MKLLGCLVSTFAVLASIAHSQTDDYELAPMLYSATQATDPVAAWQKRFEEKSLRFDQSSERAFLRSVLDELKVPIESQVLVYSKTSLQISHISPRRPRALYFSDEAYVGWVQGGDIEIISIDPTLGPIFYKLTIPRPKSTHPPRVVRSRDCLGCHGSSRTSNVPGMLVRSVRSDIRGFPLLATGTFLTEPSSPIKERWGGWYVTGTNAGERHLGNLIFNEELDRNEARVIKDMGSELTDLKGVIDTKAYLQRTSDIVALMVMEHQIAAHNALTKAAFTTRKMLHRQRELARYWNEPNRAMSETTQRVIESQATQLLRVFLFTDEFELESWGVEGNQAFQTAFLKQAKLDSSGRSLRDFHLLSRLFKHRLSYMIYSRSFRSLPKEIKSVFLHKLEQMLQTPKAHELSEHLSKKETARIQHILRESNVLPNTPST